MPTIYLSPSTQEANLYTTGGSEEYYMNQLADRMEPYLRASGIGFIRNSPDMTAASSIRASNAGTYYYPGSVEGKRAAEEIARGLRGIYPGIVRTIGSDRLGEVRRTKAPSVFLELAYHDNPEDARWITENLDGIAANLVESLCRYFGIPFITPVPIEAGFVRTGGGALNLREKPDRAARILRTIPNGSSVIVFSSWQGWKVIQYGGVIGYADGRYISVL